LAIVAIIDCAARFFQPIPVHAPRSPPAHSS
jgi:hypothetical protein